MELQMPGAKILAALLFISLLQAFVPTTKASVFPNDSTTAVSPNHNTTALSANHSTTPPSPRSKRFSRSVHRHCGNFTPEFNWEQQQYLKAHNDLRLEMGIPPLQWDSGLTAYAHSWATRRREDCKYRNHSKGHYGENSFWMQYKDFTPTEVVQQWFSEQKFFDHKTNVCKCKIENDECECGHYLNVISKTTKKLGCSGYVYCTDQQGLLVFCSYDPR